MGYPLGDPEVFGFLREWRYDEDKGFRVSHEHTRVLALFGSTVKTGMLE